jgi:molybdopterin-guanine dinucleotide biosynthesis protein A
MGRDKARLRFAGESLLGHVRAIARKTGWLVLVIRRDAVAQCGPLGGIYTALTKSRADAHLFLACDMPFVSPDLLTALAARLGSRQRAVFASLNGTAGFPFCIRATALPVIEKQIRDRQFSLQSLARALSAKLFRIPKSRAIELFNINTPEDWLAARRQEAGNRPPK